jgi:hypothetical protein
MNQIYTKFYNSAKIIPVLLGICFFADSMFGQSTYTEYFMSSSYFKTSLNPALRPTKGYIGIPGLTNISAGYQTNAFVLDHFLFPATGENGKTGLFLNENVSYDQFMKGISELNYLNLDINETLLGFGFYAGETFLSFDAGLRINAEFDIPKEVFGFLKQGITLDGADKVYDFGNIRADAIAYGQIGLGISFPLLDKSLLIGIKTKVLLGMANGRAGLDKLKLNVGKDEWSASEMQASIQTTFNGLKPKYNENGNFSGFETSNLSFPSINGYGLGLDLGATFKPGCFLNDKNSPLNNFTISLAATDLGFINWNKENTLYLATDPTDPIIITGNKEIDFENAGDIFDDLENEFKDLYNFTEKPDAIDGKTHLKAKLNWGIEYAFSKHINAGVLSTTYYNSAKAISEFTIGGAIRPVNGIEAGISYSFAYGHFQTVGLSLHLGSFFYIAGDYLFPETNSMFLPVSAKAFNLQFGLAIPIGKKH